MPFSMLATRDAAQDQVSKSAGKIAGKAPRETASGETATYRAFYLDAKHKVRAARILRAGNDSDAHTIARTLPNGFGIELWERSRFLATFPPRAAIVPDGA